MKTKNILKLLFILACFALHPPHAECAEGKRVLIINSYNDGAPWAQEIVTPVMADVSTRDGFRAPEVVYLNSTLIHNEKDYDNMANGLFSRFSERHPDYVVLVGNFSFTLRDRIKEAWGDVPMLLVAQSDQYCMQDFYYTRTGDDNSELCGGMKPLEELRGKYNFSLVQAPNLYKETIDMMKYMFPGMSKLIFIADALYLNRHLSHSIHDYIVARYPDMEYEWLVASDDNGKLLQQYLNSTDYDTGLLLSTWFFERMTIHGYPQLIAGEARMIGGSKRPVFGLRYAYFNSGITGGYFCSPEEFYSDIKAGLNDLLAGKKMSDVPFRRVHKSCPIVNYEKLIRDDIPEDSCPPGTVFLNKPETIWEKYHAYIISGAIVFLAIVGTAIGLYIFQRRRIALLSDRDRLVGNMPIGYSRATIKCDSDGKLAGLDYEGWNEMFASIMENNKESANPSELLRGEYISRLTDIVRQRGGVVRFSKHFDCTDSDYEFIVCVGDNAGGQPQNLDIFAVDITDQKKKEAMLIEAREKARESDRLKMAFLANMSHEIRTPLNAIVGFSSMLAKNPDTDKKEKFAGIIEHNNELLLKLIGDVLDMAKVESNTLDVHTVPTDINELLTSVDSTVRLNLSPRVALNLVLGAKKCEIVTDPDRVRQVFVNFLTNAMKFTRKGSITFGYEVREGEVYFFVRDTGEGISPENIGKVFSRFTKLNDFVQGTGLGLSISKSIVERLGGKIGVVSNGVGCGSLFWFTLPR